MPRFDEHSTMSRLLFEPNIYASSSQFVIFIGCNRGSTCNVVTKCSKCHSHTVRSFLQATILNIDAAKCKACSMHWTSSSRMLPSRVLRRFFLELQMPRFHEHIRALHNVTATARIQYIRQLLACLFVFPCLTSFAAKLPPGRPRRQNDIKICFKLWKKIKFV